VSQRKGTELLDIPSYTGNHATELML